MLYSLDNRYYDFAEDSTSHRLKSAYWSTKQAVIKKFGKEEDRHIIASDSELDCKLELFKSIEKTCQDLGICSQKYLKSIYGLSEAENEMGRFLSRKANEDKTRAGNILAAVGKSLSNSAQQRLILRKPLSRLEQEIQTFRNRAIGDTAQTLRRMEAARTAYRGALLWMKDVSEELDPDIYKKFNKFRRVQHQVKKSKYNFDRLKLSSMQKVDLLAASRCNMLSHVLSTYQDTLLEFWERTARNMTSVADSFKGYQYYEFSLLKDLIPEVQKLSELTSQTTKDDGCHSLSDIDDDDDDFYAEKGENQTRSESNLNLDGSPSQHDDTSNQHGNNNIFPDLSDEVGDLLSLEGSDEKLNPIHDMGNLLNDNSSNITLFSLPESGNSNAKVSADSKFPDFIKDLLSDDWQNEVENNEQSNRNISGGCFSASDPNPEADFFKVNWDSARNMLADDILQAKVLASGPNPISEDEDLLNFCNSPITEPSSTTLVSNAGAVKERKSTIPLSCATDDWLNFLADLTPAGDPDRNRKSDGFVFDA